MGLSLSNTKGDYIFSFSVKLAHSANDKVYVKVNGETFQEYTLEGETVTQLKGMHLLKDVRALDIELVTNAIIMPNTLCMSVREMGD